MCRSFIVAYIFQVNPEETENLLYQILLKGIILGFSITL